MLKKNKEEKKGQKSDEKIISEESFNQQEDVLKVNIDDDSKQPDVELSIEEQLKLALSEKEKVISEFNDKFQRSLAEFDNFRKRTAKEKTEMYDMGVSDTICDLLPVIDNFERAINTSGLENSNDAFFKGVELILRQFKEILNGMGIVEIEAVGQKFNPSLHNAVYHIEDDSFDENEIIEDLQRGYMYKNKVVRPSMVKVAN